MSLPLLQTNEVSSPQTRSVEDVVGITEPWTRVLEVLVREVRAGGCCDPEDEEEGVEA